MKPPRLLAFVLLAPLLAIGWFTLVLGNPDAVGNRSWLSYALIGNLIGSVFAQATLAAAWTALGPLRLAWRLPLAGAWVASLPLALAINFSFQRGPDEFVFIIGACVLAQWLLVQAPLGALSFIYGVRVQHWSEEGSTTGPAQFGIRQLMILTAIVAVLLGAGRIFMANFAESIASSLGGGDTLIFVFLAVAGILMTLPLVVAALLPRLALVAVPVTLIFIGLATAAELPLMTVLVPVRGGGPDVWHFISINGFQTAWILAVTAILRLGGYCLRSSARH